VRKDQQEGQENCDDAEEMPRRKAQNEPAEELDFCQELQEKGSASRQERLRRFGSKLRAKELGTKLIEVHLEKDLVGEGAWQPGE